MIPIACRVGKRVVTTPFTGAYTIPSSGRIAAPFPNAPVENAPSCTSSSFISVPLIGLMISSFWIRFSSFVSVFVSGFAVSSLSLKLIIVITKAMIIVMITPVMATIRLSIEPSGAIIAGNSKIPIPPIINFLKLKAP